MALELMKLAPTEELIKFIELQDGFRQELYRVTGLDRYVLAFPEPGERTVWQETFWMGYGEGDDGGGAALAAYRYGLCPFQRI